LLCIFQVASEIIPVLIYEIYTFADVYRYIAASKRDT